MTWEKNSEILINLKDKLDVEPDDDNKVDVSATTARIWAKAQARKPAWVYIVPGILDGKHIIELHKLLIKRKVGKIIIIETDYKQIKYAMQQTDFSQAVKTGNLIIIHTADRREIYEAVTAYAWGMSRQMALCDNIWSSAKANQEIANTILQMADMTKTNVTTQLLNSALNCDSLLKNLPYFCASKHIEKVRETYCDKPALVLGAGPSLDKSLELIELNQEKFVLIVPLTLLKPLLNRNILPDFVCAVDYADISARFLDGVSIIPESITFILEPRVHNKLVQRVFDLTSNVVFTYNDWLYAITSVLHKDRLEVIPSGTTVLHMCTYWAMHINCSPIIYDGLDMCFTNGRYYAECVYDHKFKEQFRHKKYMGVTREYHTGDGTVYESNEQFQNYLEAFESLWHNARLEDPGLEFVDCSGQGIPKHNVNKSMPLSEALDQYCTEEVPYPQKDITNLDLDDYLMYEMYHSMQQHINNLSSLMTYNKRISALVEEAKGNYGQEKIHAELFGPTQQLLYGYVDRYLYIPRQVLEYYSGVAAYQRDIERERILVEGIKQEEAYERGLTINQAYIRELEQAGAKLLRALRAAVRAVETIIMNRARLAQPIEMAATDADSLTNKPDTTTVPT